VSSGSSAGTASLDESTLAKAADAVLTSSRALLAISVRSVLATTADVTVAQHRVLVVLASHGPQTVGQIAEQLGVDQSNASRHCARLDEAGMVERTRSTRDARAREVAITKAGVALLAKVTSSRRAQISDVLARMDGDDVRATMHGLAAFNNAAHESRDSDWIVGSD
jgi:DNA-binding MarR family transcriptional regulator